jgi:hypothetical protein
LTSFLPGSFTSLAASATSIYRHFIHCIPIPHRSVSTVMWWDQQAARLFLDSISSRFNGTNQYAHFLIRVESCGRANPLRGECTVVCFMPTLLVNAGVPRIARLLCQTRFRSI